MFKTVQGTDVEAEAQGSLLVGWVTLLGLGALQSGRPSSSAGSPSAGASVPPSAAPLPRPLSLQSVGSHSHQQAGAAVVPRRH